MLSDIGSGILGRTIYVMSYHSNIVRNVKNGHTWGMSELEWYKVQAELVSLEKRKANAEKELERLEGKQRDILWTINNMRVNLRIRIRDFERWITEKEEEMLEKMMRRRQREVVKGSSQGL